MGGHTWRCEGVKKFWWNSVVIFICASACIYANNAIRHIFFEATMDKTSSLSSCTFLLVGLKMATSFKLSMFVLLMMFPKVDATSVSVNLVWSNATWIGFGRRPLPISKERSQSAYSWLLALIFIDRWKVFSEKSCQWWPIFIHAATCWALVPVVMIGKHPRKSPPIIIGT